MEKPNKVRTTCTNCLHSVVGNRHDCDPSTTRFIFTDCCDKCDGESGETLFFDSQLRDITSQTINPF